MIIMLYLLQTIITTAVKTIIKTYGYERLTDVLSQLKKNTEKI